MKCNTTKEVFAEIRRMLEMETKEYERRFPEGFQFPYMDKLNTLGDFDANNVIREYGNERDFRGRIKCMKMILYLLDR